MPNRLKDQIVADSRAEGGRLRAQLQSQQPQHTIGM
jgi:hypothetical protein